MKKTILIIVAILVLSLAVVAGGAFFVWNSSQVSTSMIAGENQKIERLANCPAFVKYSTAIFTVNNRDSSPDGINMLNLTNSGNQAFQVKITCVPLNQEFFLEGLKGWEYPVTKVDRFNFVLDSKNVVKDSHNLRTGTDQAFLVKTFYASGYGYNVDIDLKESGFSFDDLTKSELLQIEIVK